MNVGILDIAPVLSDVRTCIEFLRGRNLLLNDYICCNQICSKVTDISITDKQIFQCNSCKKRYSVRTSSFFAKSHLSLCVLLGMLFFFSNGSTITEVLRFFNKRITKPSAIQWYNYFRDIMTTYLVNFPVKFTNCEVHMDEIFVGGKQKYGKGKKPKCKTRYIFGIISKKDHKVHLQFVKKRDHAHIIPIVRYRVNQNCTIHTDGAQVYKILKHHYTHKSVVHDRNYVDPVTGVHTNSIENFWGNLKMKLKSVRGSQKQMLDGHLDEFVYRYNRKEESTIFELMLQDIAHFYPV